MKRRLLVIVLVAIVLIFAVGVRLLLEARPPALDAARRLERLEALRCLQAQSEERLTSYAPANAAGRFQIPIERAMELAVPEVNAHPPAPAAPIIPPAQ